METCGLGVFLCWLQQHLPSDPILDIGTIALAIATYSMFRATADVAKQTAELAKDTVSANALADLHHRQALKPSCVLVEITATTEVDSGNRGTFHFNVKVRNLGPGPATECVVVVLPGNLPGEHFAAVIEPLMAGDEKRAAQVARFAVVPDHGGGPIAKFDAYITAKDIFNDVWLTTVHRDEAGGLMKHESFAPCSPPFEMGFVPNEGAL